MSKFDDATAALNDRDWSSAEVIESPRTPTVVQSVRMPRELTERLFVEAQRRGVTPSRSSAILSRPGYTRSMSLRPCDWRTSGE